MTGAVISLAIAVAATVAALIYFARKSDRNGEGLANERAARASTQHAREIAEKKLKIVLDDMARMAADKKAQVEQLTAALHEANTMMLQNADAATVRKMIERTLKGGK